MSEILKNKENLKNIFKQDHFVENVYKIEEILNIENDKNLKELLEKCCKNLNNIFIEEIEKKWYDFKEAILTIVENPIWI